MLTLQRLTTDYVDTEDRIRIAGESAGKIEVIWLTHRLADRLVPHLAAWLENQTGALPRADLLLSFAQQQAQARMVPQAPVRVLPDSHEWLARDVDLTSDAETLQLNFKSANTGSACIRFTALSLRQWLGILWQAYSAAHWSAQAWPAWMTEASMGADNRQSSVVWH